MGENHYKSGPVLVIVSWRRFWKEIICNDLRDKYFFNLCIIINNCFVVKTHFFPGFISRLKTL